MVRALADETAMVIPNFHLVADGILDTFRDYAAMSGLRLNMSKMVLIPLWPLRLDAVRRTVQHDSFPAWNGIMLSFELTYLGFVIGPEGHVSQWNKAQAKYGEHANGAASTWDSTLPSLPTTFLLSLSCPISGSSAIFLAIS
eukprot:3443894-Heterocapsa_arctica.AAC.1